MIEGKEHDEEVVETEFSPYAFIGDDVEVKNEVDETTEEPEKPAEEVVDANPDEATEEIESEATEEEEAAEEAQEKESDTDWTTVSETEEVAGEKKTEEEEEDKTDTFEEKTEAWKTIAEDLGIEAETVDEFKQRLLHQKELAKKGLTNQKVDTWKGLKSLEDEALVRKELEAKKMSEEQIEDRIDVMIENRTLKIKADDIRSELDTVIERELESLSEQLEPQSSTSNEDAEEARQELKEYLSKTKEFFGGRVNEKQKDEHFDYISDGKFFDEVTSSSESIATAAWLWKYRHQILKGSESKGSEKGKKALLDNMRNPEANKSTQIPEPSGDFSSSKFLDTEQM